MKERYPQNIFIPGPIASGFIGELIAQHANKKNIGAHSIFLGQVREDEINGQRVSAIEYTAYEEMALQKMHVIREEVFGKYPLTCMHVYHSTGVIESGSVCLVVFTSSAHRRAATDACNEVVERIKTELPVWGREIFSDSTHQWKTNR